MAWGYHSTPPPPPPPRSALSKLAPLLILFIVLGIGAFVGYQIWLTVQSVSAGASKKMESKNVVFTKEGLRVGVKEVRNESYVDKTQGYLVKAWNLSTWPGYKSRYWNKEAPQADTKARKPWSRSASTAGTK